MISKDDILQILKEVNYLDKQELSEIYFDLTGEKITEETSEELEAGELNNKGASLLTLGKYQEAKLSFQQFIK